MTSLEELTRLAGEAGTRDELVRRLMAALHGISGLESIFLSRVDQAGDRFELAYTHNAESARQPIPEGLAIPWSESVCKQALSTRTAETHTARDRWPDVEVIEDLNITTYAIAPVRDDSGEVVATLCAISDRRKPVTERTRQAMKLIARLVASWMGGSVTATMAGELDTLVATSMQDDMTSLPTRAALALELTEALRTGEHFCLVMVDLAGLDMLDEREGHWASDQFLYAVSQRLASAVATEPGAFIARFGDREFAVLVRLSAEADIATGPESAAITALRERLAAATRGQYALAWSWVSYDSAVVTAVCAHDDEDAAALLMRAEDTMREASRMVEIPQALPPGIPSL